MGPKRKLATPTAIIYGASVSWIQPLVHRAADPTISEFDFDGVGRDPTLSGLTDTDIVLEAAKVAYLLYHNLDANSTMSEMLRAVGVERDTPNHKAWLKRLALRQTQWKNAILQKSLYAHVEEIIQKWSVANAYKTFAKLPEVDRKRIWLQAYNADPKQIAVSILRPVIGVLDTANVFRQDLEKTDDLWKMRAIRLMLREKILFGCEIVFKYRKLADRKDLCTKEWVGYTDDQVSIADIPITSNLLRAQPDPQLKKQKQTHEDVDL